MAKSSSSKKQQEPAERPFLVKKRADVEAFLRVQLSDGQKLLEDAKGIRTEPTLDDVRRRVAIWHGVNTEYLRHAFNVDEISNSYTCRGYRRMVFSMGENWRNSIDDVKYDVEDKLQAIEELLARLPHLPEASDRFIEHAEANNPPDTLRLLFLASNPQTTSKLSLDEEIRDITEKIALAKGSTNSALQLDIVSAWAVRPDDLLHNLNQHKPYIVHFSGHGSLSGLVLTDSQGQPKLVDARTLKALFTTLKDNIKIVILNSCYSEEQAQAIVEVVDFVIGMRESIKDHAAKVFASAFYRALCFKRTVEEAFEQAKVALLLDGVADEDIPVLLVRKAS